MYLSKSFVNDVLFPDEQSGRFDPRIIDCRVNYEVHGNPLSQFQSRLSSVSAGSMHMSPPISASLPGTSHTSVGSTPIMFSAAKRKKRATFCKTIILASLYTAQPCINKPSSSKSAGDILYNVVTQITVTLDLQNCGPTRVSEMVKEQVGYDVILLDCKCYPLLDNESTQGPEFWKSTRKIIAASKSLYLKLRGDSANPSMADMEFQTGSRQPLQNNQEQPDLNKMSDSFPELFSQLRLMNEKLSTLDVKISYLNSLLGVSDSVVCKSAMDKPMFSSCCGHLVGCKTCVAEWFDGHHTCPHCTSDQAQFYEVKGLEGIVSRAVKDYVVPTPPPLPTSITSFDHDDDDEFV